jgi:transposase-like protein
MSWVSGVICSKNGRSNWQPKAKRLSQVRLAVSPKTKDQQSEMAKLKRENDQLREEVEILNKAAAYFARDLK